MIESAKDLIEFQRKTFEECSEIIKSKNHDYTGGNSGPFTNFEASKVLGVDPVIGILMRSLDKFKRIETFVKNGTLKVPNESVEDAFNDVINYMILGKGIMYNAKMGECFDEEPPGVESLRAALVKNKVNIYERVDFQREEGRSECRE